MTVHPLRPATRHCLGRPSPHQQADRPRAHPPPKTPKRRNLSHTHHAAGTEYPVLATLSCGYPEEGGRLLTCYSPVRHSSTPTTKEGASPFDLHVLSTPPAFVLSQDQTLQTKPTKPQPSPTQQSMKPSQSNSQKKPKKPDHIAPPNPQPQQPEARQTKTKQAPKTTHNKQAMRNPQDQMA